MSYVFASPEWVNAAATDLASIGSSINEASAAAAAPTAGVVPAGADDVSAAIAALFGAHAEAFQTLSQQAASFHQQFVQLMSGGAEQYATAEAVNSTPMQDAAAAISAPLQALAGISSAGGAGAAPASGANNDERVLLTRDGGSYVQIGNTGASVGAASSGGHGAGPHGVTPGPAAAPGWVSGSGGSGALLSSATALTGTSVGAAAVGSAESNGGAGGPGVSSFGDGGPGMGGVLSGQTPPSASPTVDRVAAGAPAARGGNEGHAESVPSNGEHNGAADSATTGLDVAAGPSTGEGGLRGDGGLLYGSRNGGFYGAPAGSDGGAQPLQHRTA